MAALPVTGISVVQVNDPFTGETFLDDMLAVSHLNKSEMTSPDAVIRVALKAGIVPALIVDHIQHEAGFGVRNGVPVAVNAVEDLILCSSPLLLPALDAGAGLQNPASGAKPLSQTEMMT